MALTTKQTTFIDTFLEAIESGVADSEAFRVAKSAAGYSDSTEKRDILTDDVYHAIQVHYNNAMTLRLAKASKKMDNLLNDPAQEGAPVLLAAVNSVFDRGGVIKKESKEVTIKAPTGIVVMPGKAELDPEE